MPQTEGGRTGLGGDYWDNEAESSQPRALVALSEDRQWLVVLNPEPTTINETRAVWWSVYLWDDIGWELMGCEPDTGQRAEDVAREWSEDDEE